MNRRIRTIVLIAAATALLATFTHGTHRASSVESVHAAGVASQRAPVDWNWQGNVEPGLSIEIKGINGWIVAEPSSGSAVEIVAVKRARRSDPDGVTIQVVEHEGGITVCAVYPSPRFGRANECAPGEGGRMKTGKNDVNVDFTVRVPSGIRFIGRTVNGRIEAEAISRVEAHTINGDLELATGGYAWGATVNGSIEVSMGSADWNDTLELKTVNGSIDVVLPTAANSAVQAKTINGTISTEFPIDIHRGRFIGSSMNGTLGEGGRLLHLNTVNGSIALRRGD